MADSGLLYSWPRALTAGAWLTPRLSTKRWSKASLSVFAPLAAAIASRAQMLAMPVATPIRFVAPSRMAACESDSRFVGVSLNQTAP